MNIVDVYLHYFYMRQHMTKNYTYSPFKPLGLKNAASRVQSDRYYQKFARIATHADPISYLIGNFVYTNGFIREFSDENYISYENFKKRIKPFTDVLLQRELQQPINTLINPTDGQPPQLLQHAVTGKIDMMAVLIINNLLNFHEKWKKQDFYNEKETKKVVDKIEKLGSLIQIEHEADKYRVILLDHFERFASKHA